jgi:hypothetical protein
MRCVDLSFPDAKVEESVQEKSYGMEVARSLEGWHK